MNKEEFIKEFECWSKEEILERVFDICSKNVDLKQENKILRENAEHNDKVVDKVNWGNRLLKQQNQKYKEVIDKLRKIIQEKKYYTGNTRRNEITGELIIEEIETTLISKNMLLDILKELDKEVK